MYRHVSSWKAAVDRVRRLAASLAELRQKVREAVAVEAGKAVAEAVRDLLTAALGGCTASAGPSTYQSTYRGPRRGWADEDDDGWDEDGDPSDPYRRHRPGTDQDDVPQPQTSPPSAGRWADVVAATAGAVRWWVNRRLPPWAGVAVVAVAAFVGFAGGEVARVGMTILGAAADLLCLTA